MRARAALVMLTAAIACAHHPTPDTSLANDTEVRYRVVRFHVKPGRDEEFLRFFTESLVPAAEATAESREMLLADLDGLVLLRPVRADDDGRLTFYVLHRGPRVGSGGNEGGAVLRNLVRRAFPGEEGKVRVERWMATIDLESLRPRGADFERVLLAPYLSRN